MYNAPYNNQFRRCDKRNTVKTSTKLQDQTWYVLGVGAIGCLWAAHLGLAGHKVKLILKSCRRLKQFQLSSEIKLSQQSEEFSIPAEAELANDKTSVIRYLLVCTKSPDALQAIQSIAHRLDQSSRLILLLNGLGAQQAVAEAFPNIPLICATTTDGAYLRSPFHVTHAGVGETHFGLISHQDEKETIYSELKSTFRCLGLVAHWDNNIYPRLCNKLMVNAVINPLTAIYNCNNGEILKSADRLSLIEELCIEIESVMDKLCPDHTSNLFAKVQKIAHATAGNYSSMHQDIAAGRLTEIDYINGYLCQQAKELSIATPLNLKLIEKIKALSP